MGIVEPCVFCRLAFLSSSRPAQAAAAGEFKCPLSQFVLADALGLTAIHVNRVLRQLREEKLLTVRRGTVKIHDLGRLRKLSGFEGGYLNSRE